MGISYLKKSSYNCSLITKVRIQFVGLLHCNTSKCMQQEFEPKLPRDILKLSKNKSFYFRARFGAIYSASKTKKYLLKNSTIGNRLLF